ncbi:hypothetical protein RAS2_28940 [Phycisphaerae bacterium RAS2]|nr:hypothetical protein RAS2_28940 [Phycisphaerae bacterium RAS2]
MLSTPAFQQRWPILVAVILKAWADYRHEVSERARRWVHARTRAGFVRDAAVHRIRKKWDHDKGIRFIDRRGMFLVVIENEALVRLKKLGKNRRPSAIKTAQHWEYFSESLFGFPLYLTRLVVGYELNREQTEVLRIWVQEYEGENVVEATCIYDRNADDSTGGMLTSPPSPFGGPNEPGTRKTVVRPRDGKAAEDGDAV